MKSASLHKCFRINGQGFESADELIDYCKYRDIEGYEFLEDWFGKSKNVNVYTSGSTGKPKLMTLAKSNMVNSALATAEYFNIYAKTKALLCMSSNYIAGKMMWVRALTLGWHLTVVKPQSNPLKHLEGSFDFAAMVPLQVTQSLPKLHLIRQLIIGGGVLSNVLEDQLKNIKTNVYVTYGMTETITHIAIREITGKTERLYSVLPNIKISLDSRNCLVIDAPKLNNQKIVTNDLVKIYNNNQFEWLGRIDHVINSGGVKLSPEVIEKKLSKSLPFNFIVGSKKDEVLGEKVILIIESKSHNQDLNFENLDRFERPKEVLYLGAFCYTKNGKIDRTSTISLAIQ